MVNGYDIAFAAGGQQGQPGLGRLLCAIALTLSDVVVGPAQRRGHQGSAGCGSGQAVAHPGQRHRRVVRVVPVRLSCDQGGLAGEQRHLPGHGDDDGLGRIGHELVELTAQAGAREREPFTRLARQAAHAPRGLGSQEGLAHAAEGLEGRSRRVPGALVGGGVTAGHEERDAVENCRVHETVRFAGARVYPHCCREVAADVGDFGDAGDVGDLGHGTDQFVRGSTGREPVRAKSCAAWLRPGRRWLCLARVRLGEAK